MATVEPVRGLLEGSTQPIDRQMAWTDSLRASGSVGKRIAEDVTSRFPSRIDETTEDGLQSAIERMAYIVQQTILGTACLAKHLYIQTQEIEDEENRQSVRVAAAIAFRAAFARQCTALQVAAALVGMEVETAETRTARFLNSLSLLPDEADEEDGDAVPEAWPRLDEGMMGIDPAWIPFVSKKTGFFFWNLPLAARALYLRCLAAVGVDKADDMLAILRLGSSDQLVEATEYAEQHMAAQAVPIEAVEDNLVRHYRRWNHLAPLGVASIRALYGTLTGTARQPYPQLASLRDKCPLPWPCIVAESGDNGAYSAIHLAVTTFIHEHIFTSSDGWVLTPPGVSLVPSVLPAGSPTSGIETRISKSDGMKFLHAQLQNKSSTYRLPRAESNQRDWEAWFNRMRTLQELFPGLPAQIIIPMITGLVPIDDKRIFGWLEKTSEMKLRNEEPTLNDFLDHVRSQVMANAVTRREAYIELDRLTRDYRHLEDCQALSTKLQQLWTQLYPPVTTEIEPIGKLDVMRMIYNLLHDIRIKFRGGRSVMMKAWFDFNYDHTAMFTTYIDSELHTDKATTDTVAAAFLKEVCRQLQQAHRMSVQVGPDASAALDYVGAIGRPRSMPAPRNYATGSRSGQPSHKVATWVDRTGQGKKRARSVDGPSSSGRPRNRGGSTTGSQGRSSTPRSPSRAKTPPPGFEGSGRSSQRSEPTVELETDYKIIFGRMKEMRCSENPQDRIVGHLRGAFPGLKELSYDAAVQAVLDGACTLCQQHGHIGKFCPVQKDATGPLKQRIRAFNSMLRAARKKQSS